MARLEFNSKDFAIKVEEDGAKTIEKGKTEVVNDGIFEDIGRRLDALETSKVSRGFKKVKLDDIEKRLGELELNEVEEARRLLDVEGRLETLEKWKKQQ